jgi:hypothetical protein
MRLPLLLMLLMITAVTFALPKSQLDDVSHPDSHNSLGDISNPPPPGFRPCGVYRTNAQTTEWLQHDEEGVKCYRDSVNRDMVWYEIRDTCSCYFYQ